MTTRFPPRMSTLVRRILFEATLVALSLGKYLSMCVKMTQHYQDTNENQLWCGSVVLLTALSRCLPTFQSIEKSSRVGSTHGPNPIISVRLAQTGSEITPAKLTKSFGTEAIDAWVQKIARPRLWIVDTQPTQS